MADFHFASDTDPQQKPLPPMLTVAEAAKFLRLHEAEILRAVSSMELPATRDTGTIFFRRADIERFDARRVKKAKLELLGETPFIRENLS